MRVDASGQAPVLRVEEVSDTRSEDWSMPLAAEPDESLEHLEGK